MTSESLLQDLELARAEIRRLRDENKRVRERLQRDLGAQVQALSVKDTLQRIHDLEHRNGSLVEANSHLIAKQDDLMALVEQLRDDLQSSRTAHARLVRQVNAPHPTE